MGKFNSVSELFLGCMSAYVKTPLGATSAVIPPQLTVWPAGETHTLKAARIYNPQSPGDANNYPLVLQAADLTTGLTGFLPTAALTPGWNVIDYGGGVAMAGCRLFIARSQGRTWASGGGNIIYENWELQAFYV